MGKKNMSGLIIIILAIFLGAGYFFSIKAQKINVYQFTTNLQAGSTISEDKIEMVEVDKKLATQGAYVTDLEEIQGKKLLTDVFANTPVMKPYIATEKTSPITSALGKNKIAYTIPVDSISGVSATIKKGNNVNIYLSLENGDTKISKQLFENVKVINIEKKDVTEENPKGELSGVTLELEPKQVSTLVFGKDYGKLSLGIVNEYKSIGEGETIDSTKLAK